MIEVVDVFQHYGTRPTLRNFSLKVEGGELVAVMGPNGMGKTTLMRVIAGVLSPQKGYVEIDGVRRRSTVENEKAIRRKVVFLPDDPWLPKLRTSREFLISVGMLYEIEEERLMNHVEDLLDLFELHDLGDSPINSYSNGQKKKLAVCSTLVTEASVLLLDEPFSGGLDPSSLLALKYVLQTLAKKPDVTILLATQVPELVEGLAHKILLMKDGEKLAYGSLEDLRRESGVDGGLQEVLERVINPQTMANIEKYFGASKS